MMEINVHLKYILWILFFGGTVIGFENGFGLYNCFFIIPLMMVSMINAKREGGRE